MTFKCCICHREIPEKDIPKEAKNKIGAQLFWHNDCDCPDCKGKCGDDLEI